MKLTLTTVGTLMTWTTSAMAANGTDTTGTSLMTILLLGFGALIVALQLIPGLILFGSAMKSLFVKAEKKVTENV